MSAASIGGRAANWQSVDAIALACAFCAEVLALKAGSPLTAGLVLLAVALGVAARMRVSAYVRTVDSLRAQETATTAALSLRLTRDSLTGHLNRDAFNQELQQLARPDAGVGAVVVLFFDLNRFKEINDTLGHAVGDQLLVEVGRRAVEALPEALAIARLGGDEFAAVLPWTSDPQAADAAQSVVKTLGQPFLLQGKRVEISVSVGVAIGELAVLGCEEMLRRADLAMYEIKGTWAGGYHIFDDMLSNRQLRELSVRSELGKLRFDERFMLHYQPIVCARTGQIKKAEALLRTNAATLAGIPPSLMVSVAEDSGQIVDLTEWTIDAALQASRTLDLPVAVNISPLYFRHAEFLDRLVESLVTSRCDPSALIVEVTEGVLISDVAAARESIDHLRALGISVYLDDFGTGYSSLSYLQNFDLDGMKLDRSFIQKLGHSDKAARIIRSMIDFGHGLDMEVVVEGVESEWQAGFLQLQGCDYLQGYALGLPMSLSDLSSKMAEFEMGGNAPYATGPAAAAGGAR